MATAKLVSALDGSGACVGGAGGDEREPGNRKRASNPLDPDLTRVPPLSCSVLCRKKALLALFVALATIGLIAGLIVAFKPEKNKAVTEPSKVEKK